MASHNILPAFVVLCLLTCLAPAQAPLPASTQSRLASQTRLENMTQYDFAKVVWQAQSGEPEAQYLVAEAYLEGRLVARDNAVAASWMRKSAEQNYLPAQAGMGLLLVSGVTEEGPIPDRDEAEKWLKLAARQGDADAQLWLATGYQRGWFGADDDRRRYVG